MYGKSVFLSIFCKYIENKNKSILIIDTCEESGSINNIFGKSIIKKFEKISRNIDYARYKNSDIENNYIYLEKFISQKKKEYDYIFIDSNFEVNSDYYKKILIFCDGIVFLIEPNLIGLQKAESILEVYKCDFEIPNNKIKIIFNKSNQFQISSEILEELFSEYEILGYINYSIDYNLYINKNTKYLVEQKPYQEIYKKLFQ